MSKNFILAFLVMAFPSIALSMETYAIEFCNCAGETTSIKRNGKEVFIRFHPQSDSTAINSLQALNREIYELNADGKHLFITGEFQEKPQLASPICKDCNGQEYYYFKLTDWYIVTPFNENNWVKDENLPSGQRAILKSRNSLRSGDFTDYKGKDKVDLKRFQRTKSTYGPNPSFHPTPQTARRG